MLDVGIKLFPMTVNVKLAAPIVALAGDKLLIEGDGFVLIVPQ